MFTDDDTGPKNVLHEKTDNTSVAVLCIMLLLYEQNL